ncbi:MAG: MG2 domain-containing protein [Tenacibaculum sp.]
MKKFTITLLMIFLFSTTMHAQENYKDLWENVHQLEVDNLPKSALKIVDQIYAKAKKDKNAAQLVKTLLYKSKFSLILEEDAQLKIVNQFKEHISKSSFPTKNVLENILANLYWQYFNQNRWKFYNRTQTDPSTSSGQVKQSDFRTWDLNTLFAEIHQYYQKSLDNEQQLQQINIYDFGEILHVVKDSKKFRPSLFDFLAHNALEFYKTSETSITKPTYQFKVNNPTYLSDFSSFAKTKLITKDINSLQFNALKIYQKLIQFHLKNKNHVALVDVDLQRLHFVKQHAVFSDKSKLYLNTLKTAVSKFKNNDVSGLYSYQIAQAYHQQANTYQSEKKSAYRFKNKEALAICKQVIKQFPKSSAAKKCIVLEQQITQKSLAIVAEKFIPINQHSRALITYNNINTLHFSAYKINSNQLLAYYKLHEKDKQIAFIKQLKKVNSWNSKLRNELDYISHTTEIIIPKLPQGNYLVVTNEKETISNNNLFASTNIQVTNLALIENYNNGETTYQVVNRNNGSPIKNATIYLKNNSKRNRYNTPINKVLTTNTNGFTSYKTNNNHNNVVATVNTKNDKAIFGEFYIRKHYEQENYTDDDTRIKPFIFTDRSIYRPGQTVYFKTIFIQKKKETSKPFVNEFVQVILNDVNGQAVKKLDLKLNEFGSASGEIILPNNGLTGQYTFSIDESDKVESNFYDNADFYFERDNYIATISVEEYKRPKFKTEFKTVTEAYKINDTITVTGFAKAFSGANISDAKVVYRVHRKVQYPSWWYWRRPSFSSEAQEITHGESITDALGNFSINFKALADESVDKKSLPVFSYEITADVTDINGETRSATTTIKVGYHAMTASITVPSKISTSTKEQVIIINTNNLNNEFVPAKGTLQVFKLQAPKNPLRERPWNAPDYQDISETEFRTLFPNEAYTKNETNEQFWKKGKLVFESSFNTQESKEVLLKKFSKWISGKYIVIVNTTDKFNQKVTDKARFTLTNPNENTIADNQLFIFKTNKDNYTINEKVCLQVGSASKNITAVIQIEKNHTIVDTQLIQLSNEIKNIEIPINKEDIGGFAINYYFVNYNSFKRGSAFVSVENPKEKLEIITNTFRDKLQPGTQETWNFTIKNDKKNKVTAEVLASMYDASLDEFKAHNWQFTPIDIKQYYPHGNNANARNSFNTKSFRVFNKTYPKYYSYHQNYDQLNWFGFSFNNQRWVQKQFAKNLKINLDNTRKEYDKIIYGTVEDESGPLPGVTVIIKGTSFGTETDFDGKYSLKVKNGDVLIFSFVGMETQEKTLNEAGKVILENSDVLDEVVVTALGIKRERAPLAYNALMGKVAGVSVMNEQADSTIRIRGNASISPSNAPLYIVDGKIVASFNLKSTNIVSSTILKANEAINLYGEKAKHGAIVIITKKAQADLNNIKARKNLQETAFFYPHLTTDKKGNLSFSFTSPEALTQWKLQLLAHTKALHSAVKTLTTVTQKELMVTPNAPRFLREGDKITFSSKISNLSDKKLEGLAQLILTDAITGKEINLLTNSTKNQSFSVSKNGNANISWNLTIPENIQAIQYKIVVKAGDFSDGEQNILPVLTNRMLVTETLPMWVGSNQTKTFSLDKLKNQTSATLSHHKLTLEVTSNPTWYALQALPYLMEYPYECAEQTFARYYANTLASHITNSTPRIQEVFKQWKSSDALLSNLEKNQELKSLIIQETPWLRDAQSETEQKKRIALLFDLNKMKNEQQKASNKLIAMQMHNGGFSWFKDGRYPNNHITNHIASGFGHLKQLGVTDFNKKVNKMLTKAVHFLDAEISQQYNKLLKEAKRIKKQSGQKKYEDYLKQNHLSYFTIQYLYMRSFYKNIPLKNTHKTAVAYYKNQTTTYWNSYSLAAKGQIALLQHRSNNKAIASKILKSLKENSITSDELGMYWKENTAGWYWHQAPIETQALLIEAFAEIENDTKTVDNLKIWLLKNKQVNRWKTTKATTEAVYALLLQGSEWITADETVAITIGDKKIIPTAIENAKIEAGTGYFKTSWNSDKINANMATVTISKKDKGIAWGGLYWQYFEDLDKITSAKTALKLNKKLFLKVNSNTGKQLKEITKTTKLKVGDLITVRIELRVDRTMEFIHMKDMRASGVEPVNVLSKYKWQDGLGYYESTKDAATNFFFDRLPKGVHVFEYDVRVNNSGNFSNGITTIQNMYAPEFSSHSKGNRLIIE